MFLRRKKIKASSAEPTARTVPIDWQNAQIAEKGCWQSLWCLADNEERRRTIFSERLKGAYLISQLELYLGQEIESLAEGKRVLDVACGPVSFASSMKGTAAVEGVDPLEYPDWVYANYTRRDFKVYHCRLEDMPDEQYDVALCYNALQHFESLENACAALGRLIKPGGECLIIDYLEIPCDAAHLQYLTKKGLDAAFSDHNFSVRSAERPVRLNDYVERSNGDPVNIYLGRQRRNIA